jgi:hypothetical protein
MPDITLESRARVSDDVVFRELDGEAVLLHLEDGVYFGLDPVGTRLWQLIEQHGVLRQAHAAALAEFDVTPDVLERDLIVLVRQLADKRLVEVA